MTHIITDTQHYRHTVLMTHSLPTLWSTTKQNVS